MQKITKIGSLKEWNKTVHLIVNECSKLAQKKYKTAQTRICPHQIETNKIPKDFNLQKNHLIPDRRPDLEFITKRECTHLWILTSWTAEEKNERKC